MILRLVKRTARQQRRKSTTYQLLRRCWLREEVRSYWRDDLGMKLVKEMWEGT